MLNCLALMFSSGLVLKLDLFILRRKCVCVCLKVRWWVWAGRYFSKRGLFAHRALLYTLVPRSAQWKKIGKINVMKILSKGMLLLSQLFQNPGSSILPIFSTHSYFNNIAKNISCFIKILHTCLDVFIVLFPNSKLFFQHTVCKYCCSEKIMESFSKGPLLLVRV